MTRSQVATYLSLSLASLFHSAVVCAPTVEGIELVSATRVDRTTFDYRYSVRIRSDSYNYSSAALTVTTELPESVTSIPKPNITIGALDAGQFMRTEDVFVVRHDRTSAFDPSKLVFSFSGVPKVVSHAKRIGTVQFLEPGGRPGHAGLFPVQGRSPHAGQAVFLSAQVLGDPAAIRYSLITQLGQVVVSGELIKQYPGFYGVQLVTPDFPFRVSIAADYAGAPSDSWTSSSIYDPPPFDLRILPFQSAFPRGSSFDLTVAVRSVTAAGRYAIRLLVPVGFSLSPSSSDVLLSPGAEMQVQFRVTAPASPGPFRMSTLVVRAEHATGSGPSWMSQVGVWTND